MGCNDLFVGCKQGKGKTGWIAEFIYLDDERFEELSWIEGCTIAKLKFT